MTDKPFDSPFPFFRAPEDYLIAIFKGLEDEIPSLTIASVIPPDTEFHTPFMLIRSEFGSWTSSSYTGDDNRFARRFIADIQTFTSDPDGDLKGSLLSEIAYQRLNRAWQDQTVYPGIGHITKVRINTPAGYTPDWATSTGVNQYATLSKGNFRYEAKYGIVARPDFKNPMSESDILAILSE